MNITKETAMEIKNAELAMNSEGKIIFTYKKGRGTKTFGPFTFEEAMKICWAVIKAVKE